MTEETTCAAPVPCLNGLKAYPSLSENTCMSMMQLNMAPTLTSTGIRACRHFCLFVLSVVLILSSVQADTLRLTDGTVLTGDVRQVTDSIIEVKTDGKVRFISLNRLQPEDRARFEKRAEPPMEPVEGDDTPDGQTPTAPTNSETAIEPPTVADTIHQQGSWDEDTQDIPTLTRTAFSTDAAQTTREKAAETLHQLGYEGPVDPLIEQMGSADDLVAVRALMVMRRMPSMRMLDTILARLQERRWLDTEHIRWFGELLAAMGAPAVPRIIEEANQTDFHLGYGRDLIQVMGYLDDPRITEWLLLLVEQLDGGHEREAAYESIAQIGTPEAIEAIIGTLCQAVEADRTENTDSMWAILLLGDLGDERGVEPLIHALEREDEPSGSMYAIAESLVEIKDRRAFGPLVSKLRSSNMEMRLLAAEALGGLGDPAAIKPLMSLMVYLDADLRMTAAEGIGMIGDLRTAGVLIGYLDACPGDDNTYEPMQGLSEMGGRRVYQAIQRRMSREPADGLAAYHGQKALDKINIAGTAETEVSASRTSMWHLSCWLGFLGRWLLIAIIWFRLIANPARDATDQTARKPAWFERFVLITFVGLSIIRLLYVLIFHLNPEVLKLVVSTGMPLGRYVLCALMDPLVVLLAARGIRRCRCWGWPLLLSYVPAAALLSYFDYGYWTMVMIVGGCGAIVAFGAWQLANRLSLRPVTADPEIRLDVAEHPRLKKLLLTALVVLNSMRLFFSVGFYVAALSIFMMWGWDELSILLGLISAAIGGVADAAIMYLVNKLVLLLVCRARRGRKWVQYAIDGASGLVLFGLCILACGLFVVGVVEDSEIVSEALPQLGGLLFLIGGISFYPCLQVWRNREQKILRYFVIVTIVAFLLAQPLAWLLIT